MSYAIARNRDMNSDINKLYSEDRSVHEWYRFVLSFPPHLVHKYLERFGVTHEQKVLDPFCGTGTVLVECKKLGIPGVGIEANQIAHFASQVKVDWNVQPDHLMEHARLVAETANAKLERQGIEDNPLIQIVQDELALETLPPESLKLLLTDSISPLPLHKTLVLLECMEEHSDERYNRYERLALAKALVFTISNLHFGPEVGVGPAKHDAPVVSSWLTCMSAMVNDLHKVQSIGETPAVVHLADARQIAHVLEPHSIDAVITSPPYPNEKDYTRTTRLESVLLGFIHNKAELQALKRGLVRSNTRGVYKSDDDDQWVIEHPKVQRIAQAIETRRIELGKTSGFERLYARVTKLYFGGIARHLADMRIVLRPGAQLA